MSQDSKLSNLLKWSIENSQPSNGITTTTSSTAATEATVNSSPPPSRPLDTQALAALFGGPSDSDLMKESMTIIQSSTHTLSEKLVAFDNFEQLIESLDNSNNMAPLGLWTPLLAQLEHPDAEMRRMAAWCVGTAVQNNAQAQERALVGGAVPSLLKMFRETELGNRRKARYAVSSLVRNYQPGMDAVVEGLNDGRDKVDAGDMEGVDRMLEKLMNEQ